MDRISTSNPNKTLHEISRKILHEEIHYYHIQQQKKLELQNLALDVELLKAIEIANRSILLNHLGDYLAALCSDFKNSTEFSKPSQRKKWKFLDHSKYTDLIDCYDKEQQAIEAGLESIDSSPLTKSLHLAHKYLNGKYSSVDEIVTILRAYADRNKMVHSVGPYFQEGNHIGLRQAILRDARNIPFLGNDSASKSFRLEAKQTLDIVVRRFFSKWSWEMDGYAEPSIDMVSLRQAFEAQQQKKDPRVGRQSFEVLEEEAKLRKADDTRQKSMSEGMYSCWFRGVLANHCIEERQKENIDFEARCKQALEICAQDGTALVQDVLKELMSKLKTTQHDLETTKDNIKVTANCAASLLEGAKQTKEEHKEKMRKTKEKHEKEIREKDERISELVSEHGVKK